jgi:predicted small lipoprotein YifL
VPYSRLKLGRAIIVAGLLGLCLSACGRKGPLEPPATATNAIDLPDSDIGATPVEVPGATEVSPLAKPSKANRTITVPERSFLLDPIL